MILELLNSKMAEKVNQLKKSFKQQQKKRWTTLNADVTLHHAYVSLTEYLGQES